MTEFMQNVNYKRAVQGELSGRSTRCPRCAHPGCTWQSPEKTLYTDREKQVTASVFLKLKPGKSLSKEQIQASFTWWRQHRRAEGGAGDGDHSSGKILYKGGEADSPIMVSNSSSSCSGTWSAARGVDPVDGSKRFLGQGKFHHAPV